MGNKGSRKKKNKDKKKEKEEEKAADNNKAAAEAGGKDDKLKDADESPKPPSRSSSKGSKGSKRSASPSPTPDRSAEVEKAGTEQQKVSTEFKWDSEGNTVMVTGAWDKWQDKVTLEKKDDAFIGTVDLLPGEYLYKFIVDDESVVSKSLPTKNDDEGKENNVMVVQ